jgi:hypothetical protein
MKNTATQTAPLESLIFESRGHKVILDMDLARIYSVPTKRLNEQVKRNASRFPADFVFRLTRAEFKTIRSRVASMANRSQIATSSQKHRDPRHAPFAFTEHGAIMAANVLNSSQAVQMSVFVVRAFIRMRSVFIDSRELARKLAQLEQELKARLDIHEAAIVEVLQRIMKILDPPPSPPKAPQPEIGFHVKEDAVRYRTKREEKPQVRQALLW